MKNLTVKAIQEKLENSNNCVKELNKIKKELAKQGREVKLSFMMGLEVYTETGYKIGKTYLDSNLIKMTASKGYHMIEELEFFTKDQIKEQQYKQHCHF